MAYTNPWSDVDPPGSQAANTIDDEFRQLRLDIHERMDDVVEDWTADPVILKAGGGSSLISNKSVNYDAAAAPGSRASGEQTIRGMLYINFSGTTTSTGFISLNFNEVNNAAGSSLNYQVSNGATIIGTVGFRRGDGVPVFGRLFGVDPAGNTVSVLFRHGDGALVANHPIVGYLIAVSIADPTV